MFLLVTFLDRRRRLRLCINFPQLRHRDVFEHIEEMRNTLLEIRSFNRSQQHVSFVCIVLHQDGSGGDIGDFDFLQSDITQRHCYE